MCQRSQRAHIATFINAVDVRHCLSVYFLIFDKSNLSGYGQLPKTFAQNVEKARHATDSGDFDGYS